MYRTGVMAPPDVYELPRRPGLMAPSSDQAEPVDVRLALWTLAALLAAVELTVELALG
jgi:hypothetical protein